MDNGWVKVHRKLLQNPLFRNSKYVHLWIYLLLKANHKGDKIMWNGGVLELKEGEFVTGLNALQAETGISRTSVDRILTFLENEKQLGQRKTSKFRVITIHNWKLYQEVGTQTGLKRDSNGIQTGTNKNVKNDKNVKNKTTAPETGDGGLVNEVLSLFKDVNPSYRIWYSRPPQRSALGRLLDVNGYEKLSRVIALLPQTNKIPYLPTITTPIQLEERWAALESGLIKKKGEIISKGRGLA